MDNSRTGLPAFAGEEYYPLNLYPMQTTQLAYDGFISPKDLNVVVANAPTRILPVEEHPNQTQAISFEAMLDGQYSPDSFDFLDVDMEDAMPDCPEFFEPGCQQKDPPHREQDTHVPALHEKNDCLSTIRFHSQVGRNPEQHTDMVTAQSNRAFVQHPYFQQTVETIYTKNDLEYHNDVLELLSMKATVNSEVRVSSQSLSLRERDLPAEADTTRFSPSLAEGKSLLDCWLAGVGQSFQTTDAVDGSSTISYPTTLSLTSDSASSITRSNSKAGSICSFSSRAALGPRQGRRKRPASAEDSASSTGSSSRSKRSQNSITCPNSCGRSFTTRWTLNRHLKTVCPQEQTTKQLWVCSSLSEPDGGPKCPVCQRNATDTACTHRMAECWGRTEGGGFPFCRRDLLKSHLETYHGLNSDDANRLTDQMRYI